MRMQLDDRSNLILEDILNQPTLNSRDLIQKYNITRRQLGYSLKKINDWLTYQNLPPIERTRQGNFLIDESSFPLTG